MQRQTNRFHVLYTSQDIQMLSMLHYSFFPPFQNIENKGDSYTQHSGAVKCFQQ